MNANGASLSSTPSATSSSAPADRLKPVRIWLYVIAALVLLMVLVGGATRLTESGLSITTWKPVTGMIPPLSHADWLAEFEAYKQIPEYQEINFGMSLAAFKTIFWWEWGHRFLGRVIGIAFFVPFVVFLVQRRLTWRLAPGLFGLFLLGGLQGAIGWWMVSSGLVERTDVSQYRLATHLGAACLLFVALIVFARRLTPRAGAGERTPLWPVIGAAVLVYLQIIAGAFVAGIDAGLAYNTWPLMDGGLVPNGLWVMNPWWINFFENHALVQFTHRNLGYVAALGIIALAFWAWRRGEFKGVHGWAPLIALIVLLQVGLGVATLLSMVPISLALMHQGTAFVLIGCLAAYAADLSRENTR